MPLRISTHFCSLFLLSCAGNAAPPAQSTRTSDPPATNASSPNVALDRKLTTLLSGAQRPEQERARDRYRHPRETLEFFGIAPAMSVVELAAGRGWYTAILAPLLAADGKLAVTSGDPNGPPDSEGTKSARSLADRLSQDPAGLAKVATLVVDWKSSTATLGPDGSVDMVLTFRNLHGWIRDGVFDNVLSCCFRVMKSGGTLGVVEHRAGADTSGEAKVLAETGYVPEAYVIQQIEQAGFKLSAKSEVNANPRDTKDYPKGVWTLPPTLRLGEVDRDKYLAIGESDRMTLKFTKP